ncbi:transposase [Streptomyces sp. NBC_00846]|uniref:transposase n=1 Tax=Streptomyces sp. NBC_00846 TaxID=2975849 RepID=UPI00386F78D0|nr:transposase [Streptomyces sp. NBC_00846]
MVKYALRAGVEGTINQALDITGIRRARYRGLPKVRLQHAFSATALNVIRLDARWTTDPLERPRHSRLQPTLRLNELRSRVVSLLKARCTTTVMRPRRSRVVHLAGTAHDVDAGAMVFIPSRSAHGITNTGTVDLEFVFIYAADSIEDERTTYA